jgi:tripartite ATP-independent transporter DctM subunit
MTAAGLLLLGALFALLGAGVWVGIALMGVGAIGLAVFHSVPVPVLVGQIFFNTATTAELLSLPLFILMAEILHRTRVSAQLFEGLAPLTARLPGRLLHVNVLACTLFAAVSGSSAATAATIGRITLTELAQRGYDRRMAMGSLAGAGTLGFLIPPSIVMIVYGVLAETSILNLFIAGIVPGLLLAAAFMGWIALRSLRNPALVPAADASVRTLSKGAAFAKLLPVLALIAAIIGSLYLGIASPNEAAVVGVLGALAIAALQRCLTMPALREALLATIRTSAMIGLILAGAAFLGVAMAFLGIPKAVAAAVTELELGRLGLIVCLLLVYILLGCFLDGISMIVMTIPITLPLVVAAGYDPIWFGIFLVLAAELAQITPPVGMNLFVIQGLAQTSLGEVAQAALPYLFIMCALTLLLAVAPGIATFLISG